MPSVDPSLIIRLGTHAEKEYLEKMIKMLDGFMVAANLLEVTPGATASLIVKLAGKKTDKAYYLDPMTYAYGLDLEFLKSDQKVNKKPVRDFKRSYKKLATSLGGVFEEALRRGEAIAPKDFRDQSVIDKTCESVAKYQVNRPGAEWIEDEEMAPYHDEIPDPTAILTPYFFMDSEYKEDFDSWLKLIPQFASATAKLNLGPPVYSVICADETFLYDEKSLEWLQKKLPNTGVQGVWLWFSNLNEHSAQSDQLLALRKFVSKLSESMKVYNMHGGYFSLALSRYGLSGTAHGVGYGEQKDIAPVQGQSTPTVRYYLPGVGKRLGVPDIERAFRKLEIKTPKDFYDKICDCVICKGVLNDGLHAFTSFGELHYAKVDSKRRSQTASAAKLCRYHFLINRIKEREQIRDQSISSICDDLESGWDKWSKQPTVANDADHLVRWRNALDNTDD